MNSSTSTRPTSQISTPSLATESLLLDARALTARRGFPRSVLESNCRKPLLHGAKQFALLLHALNLADKEHVRQHTDDGDRRHVDEGRGEVDVGDEESDDDRGGNR